MGDNSDSGPTFPLVTVDWLAWNIASPGVRVIDASWHLPDSGRNARTEYDACHIPGARFFDLDGICDIASPLPHTMPNAGSFATSMRVLGLSNKHLIVVYDSGGVHAAARARWMIRAFGHHKCVILDGGLEAWKATGKPIENDPVEFSAGNFTATGPAPVVASITDVTTSLADSSVTVLDARSTGRFQGREEEPRPGIRPGHIPGSRNLYYGELYDENGCMKEGEALVALFEGAGVDPARPVIATCGSGVTACCLALGLEILGKWDVMIYDGSWVEWGGRDDLPVETGPAPEQETEIETLGREQA